MTTNTAEMIDLINRLVAEGATPSGQRPGRYGAGDRRREPLDRGDPAGADSTRRRRRATTRRCSATSCSSRILISLTSLQTDEGGDRTYEYTWAATDYDLLPDNAALTLEPYTVICTTPEGNYSFPVGIRKGVKIVGGWGYATLVPAQVREACLIQAARVFKRKDAPFGVTGNVGPGRAEDDFGSWIRTSRLSWRCCRRSGTRGLLRTERSQ